jgi:hypothetical protein
MSRRVARRKRRGKPVAVSAAGRRRQQRAVQAAIQAQITRVVPQALEQALADEVAELLGRAKYVRRRGGPSGARERCAVSVSSTGRRGSRGRAAIGGRW